MTNKIIQRVGYSQKWCYVGKTILKIPKKVIKIRKSKDRQPNDQKKKDRQPNDQKKKDRQPNDQNKKDRQPNDQKKKDRQPNDQKKNDKQRSTKDYTETKDGATRTLLKTGDEFRYSGKVNVYCRLL